jgi:N-acyl-D-aspartate/D-glutamate deacylase
MQVNRRQFLHAAGAALPAAWLRLVPRAPEGPPVLLLRGGRLYRNGRLEFADVGIDGEGRLRFDDDTTAAEIIDVAGKIVSPGFIDILADNSTNPEQTFPIFEKYKLTDGVTTALQMHGGAADTAEYYRRLGARPHAINWGVSTFVMTIRSRTGLRFERMRQVERCLEEGALGVSHSPEYQPAPFDELLEYARLAKKYERPFFLHLRYSSEEQELSGVDEAIRLAQRSGAQLHIAHLHSTGGTFHMEEALRKIRTGIGQGLNLTCCIYPYSYWATYLSSRRFGPGWQERYGLTYQDLRVVGTGERLTAESFARHRSRRALVAVPEGTMPFEKTIDLALREDFCVIGSDGGIQGEPRANSHPRGAACFATAIRYALDRKMPLETMLAKMTARSAQIIGRPLAGRGVLEEGAVADLTVFDPATIRGRASVENPNQFSAGIELVLVNGRIAYRGGSLQTGAGAPIRATVR